LENGGEQQMDPVEDEGGNEPAEDQPNSGIDILLIE
jgi:hypothetical protein